MLFITNTCFFIFPFCVFTALSAPCVMLLHVCAVLCCTEEGKYCGTFAAAVLCRSSMTCSHQTFSSHNSPRNENFSSFRSSPKFPHHDFKIIVTVFPARRSPCINGTFTCVQADHSSCMIGGVLFILLDLYRISVQ